MTAIAVPMSYNDFAALDNHAVTSGHLSVSGVIAEHRTEVEDEFNKEEEARAPTFVSTVVMLDML